MNFSLNAFDNAFQSFLTIIFSQAERSALRLAAGCAMLKICETKDVGDVYTMEQFYNLAQLAVDPCSQVSILPFFFMNTNSKTNFTVQSRGLKHSARKSFQISYGPRINLSLRPMDPWLGTKNSFFSNTSRVGNFDLTKSRLC